MSRLIFHVDVNSAFLSWEAARRVREGKPDLRLSPSAVGGDRDKRTGVILAKSIPAKRCGVRTGEPVGMALSKCPDLIIVKPDFALYERSSHAFMAICRKYAPVVEKYSIDECFLDMSNTEKVYPDPIAIAERIKNEIRDTLGFTVNVGIGSNKLLAKMAGDFEKPDKVHTLYLHEVEEKLWPLAVRDLFTVGRATAEKLERISVRTVGQLAMLDLATLQSVLGNKFGLQLYEYARGIDHTPVLEKHPDAKGYSNSVTLEENVTDYERAEKILMALSDSTAARMRADGARCDCVAVTIRDTSFQDHSKQTKMPSSTDVTREIFTVARKLFSELWNGKTPLRLLGVALTGIERDGEEKQLSFFDESQDRERERRLDRVVDSIREQFGQDTIVRASAYRSDVRVGRKHKAQLEEKTNEDL